MKNNYVITVARGFGSGGKEISIKLGELLGIPVYEKQILDLASDYSGINKALFVEADEKLVRNKLWSRLGNYALLKDVAQPSSKQFVSDTNLFNVQAKIIKDLAENESCIIIGKCADNVLKDYDNVISIYIEAPREACVKSVCNKMGITEADAHALIKKTDKYRAEYYKYYSEGGCWTNPINYDMTLNSDRIGRDKCVELIGQYVKIKMGQ